MRRFLFQFVISCCLAITVNSAWAHTYHAVSSQISFNPTTGSIELVHRAFVKDMNTVASKALGESKELSASDEPWLQSYWQRYFGLFDAKQQALPLSWVGVEVDNHYVWVYQEYTGDPKKLSHGWVHNGLLFGQFHGQVNTLDLKLAEQQAALVFTSNKTRQAFDSNSKTAHSTHDEPHHASEHHHH